MKVLLRVVVFLAAFLGVAVAGAPLSVVLNLAGLEGRGVRYAAVTGTVWRGAIEGLSIGGQTVGRVNLVVDPMALLTGAIRMDVDAAGAVQARGRATAGLGGGWSLQDATLVANLADMTRLDPEIAARGGELFVVIDEMRFDGSGRCLAARGEARSNALERAAQELDWRGPVLEGPIACEDDHLLAVLEGADDRAEVRVRALWRPGASGSVEARVETTDDRLQLALLALGFQEDAPGAFLYARTANELGGTS